MKRLAIAALAALLIGAPGAAASDPDKYIPKRAKGNAFQAAIDLGMNVLFIGDAATAFVDGRWTRAACERVKVGAYRCPMTVYYRMELGQHSRDQCEAPIIVRRKGWRFPPALSTCPDEWLPEPKGIVLPDKTP